MREEKKLQKRERTERIWTTLTLAVTGVIFCALGIWTAPQGAGLGGGMVPVLFGAGIFGVLFLYLFKTAEEKSQI